MTPEQRTIALAVYRKLEANRRQVGYEQSRPMRSREISSLVELELALAGGVTLELDCSESVTLAHHIAGTHNPSGTTYESGVGNTQLMYDHLPHYREPRFAGVCALVFFGIPGRLSTQHVCAVVEPDSLDPLLFSHGGNGAFAAHFVRYSVERRFHVGEPVFLAVAGL